MHMYIYMYIYIYTFAGIVFHAHHGDDIVSNASNKWYTSCIRAKVDKWTYGAFASTHLERELMARGVKRILLCALAVRIWKLK